MSSSWIALGGADDELDLASAEHAEPLLQLEIVRPAGRDGQHIAPAQSGATPSRRASAAGRRSSASGGILTPVRSSNGKPYLAAVCGVMPTPGDWFTKSPLILSFSAQARLGVLASLAAAPASGCRGEERLNRPQREF